MNDAPLLPGVMLEDSLVLGWQIQGDMLVFEIEASLWPGHAAYDPPRPNEWTCYKRARLIFQDVTAVHGLAARADPRPHVGDDGVEDFGTIDVLRRHPGGYRITGEFGDVVISARAVCLDIESAR